MRFEILENMVITYQCIVALDTSMGDTYGVSRSAGLLFTKHFDHFVVGKLYSAVHLLWGSHITVAGALLYNDSGLLTTHKYYYLTTG